ncbi:hypothetical protein DFS34DRAFT_683946 [Phlyctochytrium arcticum]|nr:hypothetical protein DFS34DRAFT_683946 [Phlyctochytrium arcticum]
MDIAKPVSREVSSVAFSFLSGEEIRKLSSKQITNPVLFDNLNHPTKGGLYDPCLGPHDKGNSCGTCSLGYFSCPGHFGHIQLGAPVYNPITFKLMYKLLQSVCFYCHKLRSSRIVIAHYGAKLRLIQAGLITEAAALDDTVSVRGLRVPKKKKSKAKKATSKKIVDDEAVEADEDEDEDEDENENEAENENEMDLDDELGLGSKTEEDTLRDIEEYVTRCLGNRTQVAPVKTMLVMESLRKLERQFLAAIPSNSCAGCRGQSPKFRKEGQHKIFQKPLSAKSKTAMDRRGMKFERIIGISIDNGSSQAEGKAAEREKVNDTMDVDAIIVDEEEKEFDHATRDKFLTPLEVREHLKVLWEREQAIFDLLFGATNVETGKRSSSWTMFFLDVVSVTPTRFRPISKMNDMLYEHPQNTHLSQILKANLLLQDLRSQEREALGAIADKSSKLYRDRKGEFLKRTVDAWIKLQTSVNYLMDSANAPTEPGGKLAPLGIRQLLEKKEGLFRKHMMGKRVNYAARSVISPDPYIETNEIGIPPVFATKLTYPEPVTHHNVKEMRSAVINGPTKWPGATHVQSEDGEMINLASMDEAGRTAIASQLLTPTISHTGEWHQNAHTNKKVFRHLRNGDFLLLNRQPTLHKPSIMAHTARVLPGERTIRMHYANCLAGDCKVLMADGTTVRLDEVPTGAQVAAWAEREQSPAVPVSVAGVGTNVAIPYEAENTYDIGGSHTVTKGKWYRGIQECLTLTLDDGRTLVGTADHRVLACPPTANDESPDFANAVYVPIAELKEDSKNGWRVLCSATDDIRAVDESEEERGKLMRFKLSDDLSCKNDPTRVFAMLRLCGACMTDGNKNSIYERFHYVSFCCGTWEDVQELLRDVRMVDPESKPKVSFHTSEKFGSCFRVSVAGVVPQVMHELGMPSGRRSHSASWMFGFVTDPETPKLALQHFLAGWWGGDGSSPTFSDSGDTVSIGRCGIITRLAADGVGNEESRASLRNYMAALQSAFAAIGIKIRLAERYICSVQDGSHDRMLPYNPETGIPHASVASLLVRLVLDAPKAMTEDELYTAACEAYEDSALKMQGIIRSELNHLLKRGKPSRRRRRSAWANVLQIRDNVVVVADDNKENTELLANESDTYNVLQRYFRIDICMSAEETHKFVDRVGVAYSGEKRGKWHLLYAYRNIGLRVCRQRYILLTDAIHRWRQNRSIREAEKTAGVSTRKMTRLMNISTAIAEAVQALEEVEVVHPAAVPGEGFFKNYTAGHYSLPASVDLVNRGTFSLPRDTFPMFKDFVRETGFNWYRLGEDRNRSNRNCFTLAVADVRTAGALPVYDLEVKDVHNFVANGIVVHNCNTYNADFDGDEMNAHFPQNEIARAEAMLIARTDKQYLVPTDGGVLRGLIQDHVDAGVDMCSRDTFFTREEYIQLLYSSLRPEGLAASTVGNGNIEQELIIGDNGRVLTMEPTFYRPRPLWTGKQLISSVLLNLTASSHPLNLKSKSKIPAKSWGGSAPEEQNVLFMDGHLLTGILDKSQFGASANGLVHAMYEVYGPPYAGKLLSILGRLFTAYLQMVGFSCRMDDLRLTTAGDTQRRQLIAESQTIGREAALEYVGLKDKAGKPIFKKKTEEDDRLRQRMEGVLRVDEQMAGLDSAMKSRTNKVTSKIISTTVPDQLFKPFPQNNMQVMTISGAKGSNVNVSQISCLLGQQELEGRRVPTMISGKTLPSFKAFDTAARAGGFITGRFLTGIKPQEYFFHCMAGREGLIDTAVKTSRSGYLQRCLIKPLEGLKVHYDHTVRDSDGSVVQFHYGEDSLDVTKQKTLTKFDFCAMNYRALVQRYDPARLTKANIDTESVDKIRKRIRKGKESGESPILERFSPSRTLGAVSEKFADELETYVTKNPDGLLSSKKSRKSAAAEVAKHTAWSGEPIPDARFKMLMNLKYMTSLAEPGEAVGLLAAQSIGEPSTQMTLNTFHFAGFGAKNVTLGIPRLREIIMTASASIKTPMMRLPMLESATSMRDKLVQQLSRLVIGQLMEEVTCKEKLSTKGQDLSRKKVLTLRLQFWPKEAYARDYGLKPEDVAKVIERRFCPALERAIVRELKSRVRKTDDEVSDEGKIGVSLGSFNEGGGKIGRGQDAEEDDDESPPAKANSKENVPEQGDLDDEEDAGSDLDEGDDVDASNVKLSKNRKQHTSYDAPDDEDEADMKKASRVQEARDSSDDSDSDDEESANVTSKGESTHGASREQRIVQAAKFIVGYKMDDNGRWCELTLNFPSNTKKFLMVELAKQVCHSCIVREVNGLQRAYDLPNESENDKSTNVGTDGVNLQGMWEYAHLIDVNKLYTNDVAAVLNTYGVEAARASVMQEIAGVFAVYGINVDSRHLSLIADYMTFEGGYKPFNRMGMNTNPSPFAQMSFETTTNFLTTATLLIIFDFSTGDFDSLDSPSARLVMGQVVKAGTGAFEVRQPLHRRSGLRPSQNIVRDVAVNIVRDVVVEA